MNHTAINNFTSASSPLAQDDLLAGLGARAKASASRDKAFNTVLLAQSTLENKMPTLAHATQANATQNGYDRDADLLKANKNIDKLLDQFVASVFWQPIVNQATSGPFKSDMFSGGLAEEAFQSKLNVILADNISGDAKLDISNQLGKQFFMWLENQSDKKINDVANMQGIDTVG